MGSLASVLLSSVLFSLSHPNFINANGFGSIAFVCFVPLFYSVVQPSFKFSFLYGFLFGAVSYLILNFWLYSFDAFAILLVPLFKGVEWGLTLWILRRAILLFDRAKVFIIAAICTVSFYLQECFFFGYSYGNIAYALYRYPLLLQASDIFGIWLLVFMVVYINAFAAMCFSDNRGSSFFRIAIIKLRLSLIVSFLLLLFTLLYGGIRLSYKNKLLPSRTVKVATVQQNSDTFKGGYSHYRDNLNTLKSLTYDALLDKPDLIVWAETAIVPSIRWHKTYKKDYAALSIVDDFLNFASLINTPLIFGNGDAFMANDSDEMDIETALYYNSAMLYENGIKGVYHKQHLVPISESFPNKEAMPHLYNFLKNRGFNFWDSGNETVVFTLENGVKLFTPICFEDTFASISREGVKNGARLIVNLTNDYWSLSKVSEMQHLSAAVFRSVENAVPTVRSTNSGASCYIDIKGNVNGLLPLFEKAYGVYDVSLYDNTDTLYTFWGDIPIIAFSIIITLVIFLKLTRSFKRCKIKEW